MSRASDERVWGTARRRGGRVVGVRDGRDRLGGGRKQWAKEQKFKVLTVREWRIDGVGGGEPVAGEEETGSVVESAEEGLGRRSHAMSLLSRPWLLDGSVSLKSQSCFRNNVFVPCSSMYCERLETLRGTELTL